MVAWYKIKDRVLNLSLISIFCLILIFIGWVLRLRQYLQDNSLWLDESMLALNIIQRNLLSLLKPLDYNQGAPPAFLWAVKSAVFFFGNNEYSLRIIPFAAGCLLLLMIWYLSRKVSSQPGILFALCMTVFGKSFISFSVQVKQYSVDAAVTLFLYIYGLKLFKKELSNWDKVFLGLAGVAAAWISHTATFTLPALAIVLLFTRWRDKGWKEIIQFIPVMAAWLVNFICLYLLVYRSLNANQFLMDYWSEYFLPITWSAPVWIFQVLGGLFYSPGELVFSGPQFVIVLVFLLGLVTFLIKRSAFGWIFLISIFMTLTASVIGKYPFGGRMVLFLVPGLLICAGEGLNAMLRLFSKNKIIAWAAVCFIFSYLVFSPFLVSTQQFIKPKVSENIAPTMAFLKNYYKEGDVVYLYYLAVPAYRYYARKFQLEKNPVFVGQDWQSRVEYKSEVDKFSQNHRVWLLFSHLTDPNYIKDRDAILERAYELGKKKREFNDPGTAINLYLFDFSR